MYLQYDLVQKTIATCLRLQGDPKVPRKAAPGHQSEVVGAVPPKQIVRKGEGEGGADLSPSKVEGDVRQIAGNKRRTITVPIRQLCDAAHRKPLQRIQNRH